MQANDEGTWEAYLKHEVRGFTYRFTIGIDEVILECDRCGALVPYSSIGHHRNWHTLIAPLLGAP